MTGAIPSYGKHFRLEPHLPWDGYFAGRRYVLKADDGYVIHGDKTSKRWHVFLLDLEVPRTRWTPFPSLTVAMDWTRRLHALMTENGKVSPDTSGNVTRTEQEHG